MISEDEILSIAQTNKEKAFESAFNQYWEALYAHAFKKTQSEEVAKDIVQEVFIVFWDNLESFAGQKQLIPYLYAVLRNKILKLFEKDEVRLRYAINSSKFAQQAEPSCHNLLVGKELEGIITDEVAKMPCRMREIYLLKKEEQLSIPEISQRLSLSKQTVKNQLQNAMHRLKDRLKSYDPSLVFMALAVSALAH